MFRSDPDLAGRADAHFILYVEGPRDLDTLRSWARGISPALSAGVERCGVILGGRRPARAIEHFREQGGASAGARALCVLDRDRDREPSREPPGEPGLEFFTWRRRHIESYLLVRDAIRRCLPLAPADRRADSVLRELLPRESDEAALREIDAKRLLATSGPLCRGLGVSLSPARIARAMRREELHEDVRALLDRVRDGLGLREREVVFRTARSAS